MPATAYANRLAGKVRLALPIMIIATKDRAQLHSQRGCRAPQISLHGAFHWYV